MILTSFSRSVINAKITQIIYQKKSIKEVSEQLNNIK